MTHILIVESSPRGTESASRILTDKLRKRLEMQYPGATIIERDLVKDKLPPPGSTDRESNFYEGPGGGRIA